MGFIKKLDEASTKVPPRKHDAIRIEHRTKTEIRIEYYSNNIRLQKLLNDCITLFEQGKSADFISAKIESYAHIHSLNCSKCKSENKYTKCYVFSDILRLSEILFL